MNDIARCVIKNFCDENNNPSGGGVYGRGLSIQWQDGPLGRGADRKEPNGAFVETVISACIQRLDFYQTASDGKFACLENRRAIAHLAEALTILEERTKEREVRAVEGLHKA